jgi:lactate dehydrogenase-like 2-hydroxyacid dehydrogenase
MSSNGPTKILITDAEFGGAASALAAKFPDLELISLSDDQDLQTTDTTGIEGLISQFSKVDAGHLARFNDLKVVLKLGRSYHNIDVEEVRRRQITMAAVPRKGPNCVAELAITLMLALSKDLLISHESVASGAYRLRGLTPERSAQWKMAFHWMHNTRVHEIRGKTLGIIGMGEIGCELARRAGVMGMRNLYYKRSPLAPELERRFDASYSDLDALLEESDYVCLAVPHTPETEKLIGARELGLMKQSAFLVNICRGGVVDEDALIEALRQNQLAGAGLDVFTFEPLQADSPLLDLDNVILTPHIGGGSGSNRELELGEALIEIQRILNGEPPLLNLS